MDDLLAEAMSRPDTLHPRVPGVAGNAAAFAAIYRFDFDAAHRLLDWAAPYQEMMGPFATVYGRCFGGMAARYQLDIPAALQNFREAFEIATRRRVRTRTLPGSRVRFSANCSTRPAILAEATRLLDESYQLGSDGGGVDYLAARYVIGARVKAATGRS